MTEKQTIDAMWDDSPVDVSTEVNFIWSIANKLRGTYQSDKYKDVIIPMVIIRRFECALAPTKQKVIDQFKANPTYPAKAMYRVSGYQFYNTSEFDLAELVNDADHLAANFKSYIQGFSANIQDTYQCRPTATGAAAKSAASAPDGHITQTVRRTSNRTASPGNMPKTPV